MSKPLCSHYNALCRPVLGMTIVVCLVLSSCKKDAHEKDTQESGSTAQAQKVEEKQAQQAPPVSDPRGGEQAPREAMETGAMETDAMEPGGTAEPGVKEAKAEGTHHGKPFTLTENMDIETILKDPKAFEGKTVRVQGLVPTYCHHKRTWFGLQSAAGAKGALRVMVAPGFIVPKDVKNGVTRATAEGVVEIKTIKEGFAKHLAREHGLFGGEPDMVRGPQHWVHLKATGAFIHK